jgi:hypothetical protein
VTRPLFGLLAPPIAWLGYLVGAYFLTSLACHSNLDEGPTKAGLAGIAVATGLVIAVAAVAGARSRRIESRAVLGSAALVLAGLFAFAIVLTVIALVIVRLCSPQ